MGGVIFVIWDDGDFRFAVGGHDDYFVTVGDLIDIFRYRSGEGGHWYFQHGCMIAYCVDDGKFDK